MAVPPLTRNCKCRPTAEAFGRFDQLLKSNNRVYPLYQANSFAAGFLPKRAHKKYYQNFVSLLGK